jgi:hypothetical protein
MENFVRTLEGETINEVIIRDPFRNGEELDFRVSLDKFLTFQWDFDRIFGNKYIDKEVTQKWDDMLYYFYQHMMSGWDWDRIEEHSADMDRIWRVEEE